LTISDADCCSEKTYINQGNEYDYVARIGTRVYVEEKVKNWIKFNISILFIQHK